MTSDPVHRLRAARPPLPDWASSPAGRDQWQLTERRGLNRRFPTGTGPSRGPGHTRWVGLLAAAVLLICGTAAATAAITRPPANHPRGYELPIIALRTTATGDALVVEVIAVPCLQTQPRADAVETATTVTVGVSYDPVLPARTGVGCAQVPQFTTLTAPLKQTLGSRAVHDRATGRTLQPFDGSRLIHPAWLPPGYRLTFEAGDSDGRSWLRQWTLPTPPYFVGTAKAPCLSHAPDIEVSQGPAQDHSGMGYVRVTVSAVIHGSPATITRDQRGQTFLSWSPRHLPAGQTINVMSLPTCSDGQRYLPISSLLRVARSLQ